MENFIEIIIYLVILVGSGLIQVLRNKKKDQDQPQNNPQSRPPQRRREVSSPEADTTTRRPTTSFEDIWQELMGEPRKTEVEPETYRPPTRSRQKRQEQEEYSSTSSTYQKAVKQADEAEKLDDRIDLEKLDEFIQPLYSKKMTKRKTSRLGREVKAMLRNPDSAKKAVILSEILNRKHF